MDKGSFKIGDRVKLINHSMFSLCSEVLIVKGFRGDYIDVDHKGMGFFPLKPDEIEHIAPKVGEQLLFSFMNEIN